MPLGSKIGGTRNQSRHGCGSRSEKNLNFAICRSTLHLFRYCLVAILVETAGESTSEVGFGSSVVKTTQSLMINQSSKIDVVKVDGTNNCGFVEMRGIGCAESDKRDFGRCVDLQFGLM